MHAEKHGKRATSYITQTDEKISLNVILNIYQHSSSFPLTLLASFYTPLLAPLPEVEIL